MRKENDSMQKKQILQYIIAVILAVLILGIIIFLILKSNNFSPIFNNDLEEFESLSFKLPNNYVISKEENNDITYTSDKWTYLNIKTSSLTEASVMDFLKKNNYPEDEITQENINDIDWYKLSYSNFGNHYYYYITENDGTLYELTIWASNDDDPSILENDVNSIVQTLKF